jgi:hypothetical protein
LLKAEFYRLNTLDFWWLHLKLAVRNKVEEHP